MINDTVSTGSVELHADVEGPLRFRRQQAWLPLQHTATELSPIDAAEILGSRGQRGGNGYVIGGCIAGVRNGDGVNGIGARELQRRAFDVDGEDGLLDDNAACSFDGMEPRRPGRSRRHTS